MFKNAIKHGIACVVLAMLTGSATAQLTAPVLSGGGTVHSDGTILVLGQLTIGITGSGPRETNQGAVPCWLDTTECPGDLDGDNDVDIQDLSTLLSNFGTASGAGREDGDLDGDGDVDLSDMALLLSAFGTTC